MTRKEIKEAIKELDDLIKLPNTTISNKVRLLTIKQRYIELLTLESDKILSGN